MDKNTTYLLAILIVCATLFLSVVTIGYYWREGVAMKNGYTQTTLPGLGQSAYWVQDDK